MIANEISFEPPLYVESLFIIIFRFGNAGGTYSIIDFARIFAPCSRGTRVAPRVDVQPWQVKCLSKALRQYIRFAILCLR